MYRIVEGLLGIGAVSSSIGYVIAIFDPIDAGAKVGGMTVPQVLGVGVALFLAFILALYWDQKRQQAAAAVLQKVHDEKLYSMIESATTATASQNALNSQNVVVMQEVARSLQSLEKTVEHIKG